MTIIDILVAAFVIVLIFALLFIVWMSGYKIGKDERLPMGDEAAHPLSYGGTDDE